MGTFTSNWPRHNFPPLSSAYPLIQGPKQPEGQVGRERPGQFWYSTRRSEILFCRGWVEVRKPKWTELSSY